MSRPRDVVAAVDVGGTRVKAALVGRPMDVIAELTGREGEVLKLLAEGRTAQKIGAELHLSEATVKTHLHNLYEKLNVSDRTHAAVRAIEMGLLTPEF